MSQQGEKPAAHEDDWWRKLYDETAPDTGPSSAPDSLDDRFDSVSDTVSRAAAPERRPAPGPAPEARAGRPPEPRAERRPEPEVGAEGLPPEPEPLPTPPGRPTEPSQEPGVPGLASAPAPRPERPADPTPDPRSAWDACPAAPATAPAPFPIPLHPSRPLHPHRLPPLFPDPVTPSSPLPGRPPQVRPGPAPVPSPRRSRPSRSPRWWPTRVPPSRTPAPCTGSRRTGPRATHRPTGAVGPGRSSTIWGPAAHLRRRPRRAARRHLGEPGRPGPRHRPGRRPVRDVHPAGRLRAGDSARFRGEPRRDALLTARFGAAESALVLVAVAGGVRGGEGAHLAAADACRWIGGPWPAAMPGSPRT